MLFAEILIIRMIEKLSKLSGVEYSVLFDVIYRDKPLSKEVADKIGSVLITDELQWDSDKLIKLQKKIKKDKKHYKKLITLIDTDN